ncbi:M48 family metalloprotease [Nocardia aurantia]|uniref:Protease HtpX n=1 Tax=Nocardia aurantia TaxID=2585199 RepID=A0A7K0DLC3_9NOCA|nr:M48 family metalloprotease [Nocardia aurantia]MQY26566.1 Protease HtpX [Nocardia aurantia]
MTAALVDHRDTRAIGAGTTARFILLLVLLLSASASLMADLITQVLLRPDWGCVLAAGGDPDGTAAQITAVIDRQRTLFEACERGRDRRLPIWVPLMWLVLVPLCAAALFPALHAWQTRRGRVVPLAEIDRTGGTQRLLAELVAVSGLRRAPRFVVDPAAARAGAVVFGRTGRATVCLYGGLLAGRRTRPHRFRAVVLHELAHIRNGDVTLAYATVALWRAFVAIVLIPYTSYYVYALCTHRNWRTDRPFEVRSVLFATGLVLLVYLARAGVLRHREMYADLAAVDQGADPRGWVVPVATEPRNRTRAALIAFAQMWRSHPRWDERRATLVAPAALFGLERLPMFLIGASVDLLGVELHGLLYDIELPTWATEFITLIPAGLVTVTAGYLVWRAVMFAVLTDLRPPSGAGPGFWLGAGMLVADLVSNQVLATDWLPAWPWPLLSLPAAGACYGWWVARCALLAARTRPGRSTRPTMVLILATGGVALARWMLWWQDTGRVFLLFGWPYRGPWLWNEIITVYGEAAPDHHTEQIAATVMIGELPLENIGLGIVAAVALWAVPMLLWTVAGIRWPRRPDSSTRHQGNFTRHQGNSAWHHGNPTRHHGNPAQHRGNPTRHHGNPAQHRGNPTRHQGNPARHQGNPPFRPPRWRLGPGKARSRRNSAGPDRRGSAVPNRRPARDPMAEIGPPLPRTRRLLWSAAAGGGAGLVAIVAAQAYLHAWHVRLSAGYLVVYLMWMLAALLLAMIVAATVAAAPPGPYRPLTAIVAAELGLVTGGAAAYVAMAADGCVRSVSVIGTYCGARPFLTEPLWRCLLPLVMAGVVAGFAVAGCWEVGTHLRTRFRSRPIPLPEAPAARAPSPADQPPVPVVRPPGPAVRSSSPADQPPGSVDQPPGPAVQTSSPADQLPSPAVQASGPVVRPSSPAVQASGPVVQPSSPADQPSDPVDQLSSPADQPSDPVVRPSSPAVQASGPVVRPSSPAVQASGPVVQPSSPADQPSDPADQPPSPADRVIGFLLAAAMAAVVAVAAIGTAPHRSDTAATSVPDGVLASRPAQVSTATRAIQVAAWIELGGNTLILRTADLEDRARAILTELGDGHDVDTGVVVAFCGDLDRFTTELDGYFTVPEPEAQRLWQQFRQHLGITATACLRASRDFQLSDDQDPDAQSRTIEALTDTATTMEFGTEAIQRMEVVLHAVVTAH